MVFVDASFICPQETLASSAETNLSSTLPGHGGHRLSSAGIWRPMERPPSLELVLQKRGQPALADGEPATKKPRRKATTTPPTGKGGLPPRRVRKRAEGVIPNPSVGEDDHVERYHEDPGSIRANASMCGGCPAVRGSGS